MKTLLILLMVGTLPAWAASKTDIRIAPGPATMSAEEKAIVANPAAGEEHSVILLEETERQENLGAQGRTTFHLRAKILSNEGRSLANIEIPYFVRLQSLGKWWGRTILPDGTVHDLKEHQLEQQSLVQKGDEETRAIKAALPGVVVGAVIDYGYEMLLHSAYMPFERVVLQREQPIRHLRYRWRPADLPSGYIVSRADGLDVKVTRDAHSVLIEGHDLPAVPSEEYMPPEYDVRASILFHYLDENEGGKDFWDVHAKRTEDELRRFCGRPESLAQAIAAMGIDLQAPVRDRIDAAYRWIQQNIKKYVDERDPSERPTGRTATATLAAKAGDSEERDFLFACLSRALGNDAWLAQATDRRSRLFDRNWPSPAQFSGTLVALPGLGSEGASLVADPSSAMALGQVPWWFSGAPVMVATPDKARILSVSAPSPKDSLSEAEVDISFSEDNQAVLRRWSLTNEGQLPLEFAPLLRDESAARTLAESWCRNYSGEEVLRSELKTLTGGRLRLECETEQSDAPIDDSIGRYAMHWAGRWLGNLPDLPEGARFHPVVFDYPRVDLARVVVHAPHGFAPSEAPADVKLQGPYGKYAWHAERGDDTFTIERAFALVPLGVPVAEYDALRAFLDGVRLADRTAVEFRRNREEEEE